MPQFEISKAKFFSTHCWVCCWFPMAQIVWQLRFLALRRKATLLNVPVIKWKQCIKNLHVLLRSPCFQCFDDPVCLFRSPGASKARKSHAKFEHVSSFPNMLLKYHANKQAEKCLILENCKTEWKMRQKKKINLERWRQWLAWLLRKLSPRVTEASKESKMVGYSHVFLFSCWWW